MCTALQAGIFSILPVLGEEEDDGCQAAAAGEPGADVTLEQDQPSPRPPPAASAPGVSKSGARKSAVAPLPINPQPIPSLTTAVSGGDVSVR